MAFRLLNSSNRYINFHRKIIESSRRCVSVATAATEKYQPKQNIHGYTVQKVVPVPELHLTAVVLSHDNTGAEHLHIARDDTNNVFGVSFRTTPRDNTGVPHILEHTALCGSCQFPVRDPFFKMLTRSLNTFMNAFTASDWTMYPFSTQNRADYNNLLSVYLDAAFFPRLRELDFMQEGWRLEHENPEDPDSPIVYKGVVYNEMKGVFSTGPSLFAQRNQNLLLPSHTYAVVSGGDPPDIPTLSWQQLRDFHATHYHPSNSRFYTYGDFPLEEHLEFINETTLSQFSKIETNTSVPTETKWSSPRESEMRCMPDPMAPDPGKQTTVAVSYLLADITDSYESFVLSLLGTLLVDGETSPFYQSLIAGGLGSDFSPVLGYNGETRDSTFSVGLQNVSPDNVNTVKSVIEHTFEQVIKDGVDPARIEALLHKIELGQKHQTEKFGLGLGIGVLSSWNHNGDPTELLEVNAMVTKLKADMAANPTYLQDKINKYFKNNTHKLTLVMHPDEDFEVGRQNEEKERLGKTVDSLTTDDKANIFEKGKELLVEQMKESDLSCLPTLGMTDIQPTAPQVTLDHTTTCGATLQMCRQPTNGVVYFRAIGDISGLDRKLVPYVPLFSSIVTRMAAGERDYKQLSQQMDLTTGGLSVSPHIAAHHTQQNMVEQGLYLSSYCLDRNLDYMYELWQSIIHKLDMSDKERLATLILMEASELANSIAFSGHRYAMTHASSTVNPASALQEQMSGLTQVALMKSLAEGADIGHVLECLTAIAEHVTKTSFRFAINATPEFMPTAQKTTSEFIESILDQSKSHPTYFHDKVPEFSVSSCQTHFKLPFQVNYAGKSTQTVAYTHKDHPSLRILASLMGTKFLHREIREKGGAYGGGAVGSSAGQFSFYSYRDPYCERTLVAFQDAVQWASEGNFSQEDIDESKLSVFSQVDGVIPPGSQGLREFVNGVDYATYQEHRERLIGVTKDDILRVNQEYLSNPTQPTSISVLGPESTLINYDKWNVIAQS